MSDVTIKESYRQGDIGYLFDRVNNHYFTHHVTRFQRRNNLDLAQPTKLAMELPEGAFIAGGFLKSIVNGQTVKDYDVFFNGDATFKNMIRRIQNAPEGSFLHGYQQDKSVREFANGKDKALTFSHPEKPAIQLHRVRWYAEPREAIDKFDFTVCKVAMDTDLNVTYYPDTVRDAQSKRLNLTQAIFYTSIGYRIQKYELEGYTWYSNYYDRSHRKDFVSHADRHWKAAIREAEKLGKPAPTVNETYVPFHY